MILPTMTYHFEDDFDWNALKTGDKIRIIGYFENHSVYRKKLLSMGLLPGTEFILKRIAPLGDPIEIEIRGFSLVLRKKEAKVLKLQRVA
jgi:ferrous iron transport protein A